MRPRSTRATWPKSSNARPKRVGLDPRSLAGHSLRAGFATTAASVGANMAEIARVTRHESDATLRRYIRAGTMFDRDPLRGVLVR
jgi:hypothetical protein